MNEILKKRIEEAAIEYSESIPQSDERKKYSREDFVSGAEYALSHQWISVEEALPEKDELVLVKHKPIAGVHSYQNGISIAYIQNQGSCGLRWIINGMSWKINRDNINDNTVTHWMPIPKFTN